MSQTAGVKPMTISGRVARERERCLGMTDAERAFRKQWLKDQILAPNEPVYVEEYWKERINPIRRVYRKPLDLIFGKLSPFLVSFYAYYITFILLLITILVPSVALLQIAFTFQGETRAADYRYITGKLLLLGFGILCTHYYFKYNDNVSISML